MTRSLLPTWLVRSAHRKTDHADSVGDGLHALVNRARTDTLRSELNVLPECNHRK